MQTIEQASGEYAGMVLDSNEFPAHRELTATFIEGARYMRSIAREIHQDLCPDYDELHVPYTCICRNHETCDGHCEYMNEYDKLLKNRLK